MTWPHVDLSIDPNASLVNIRLVGEVTDDLTFEAIFRFLDEHPEASACDTVVDVRDFTNSVTAVGVARLAAEYRRRFGGLPIPRRVTVIVCHAPNLHAAFLKLLSAHFPGCLFRLANDMIEAGSLLAAMARGPYAADCLQRTTAEAPQ